MNITLSTNYSYTHQTGKSLVFNSAGLQRRSTQAASRMNGYIADEAVEKLHNAIIQWDLSTVKYLIENKLVDPNAKIWGKIPVVRFVCGNIGYYTNSGEGFDIASYIIGLPQVDINACDDRGNNALLFCCDNDDDYLISEILKRNDVNIDLTNAKGQTAYDMASNYTSGPLADRRFRILTMLENYKKNAGAKIFDESNISVNHSSILELNEAQIQELTRLFDNRFSSSEYSKHKSGLAKFVGVSSEVLDSILMKNPTAYKEVLKKIHPDKHSDIPYAKERTVLVNKIFEG